MIEYKKIEQNEKDASMVIVNAERLGDDAPASFADADKNPYEDDETVVGEEDGKKIARGAAVLWGIFGCILGGFPLAILGAWGGAHTATHNDGPVGDLSRSLGEVAVAASKKAKEKQIKEKTGNVAKATARQVKESFRGMSNRNSNASAPEPKSSQKPNAEVL
mmetsp:Transcript_4107/g.11657  ORF Transcript_4107/g.11657 Transcript_4107/m.11657 type:complete len:163 (+) Transcript_4107:145-633(+)